VARPLLPVLCSFGLGFGYWTGTPKEGEDGMKRLIAVTIAGVALMMTPLLAHATITFTLGNNPQPNEENILLNTGGTGLTVAGTGNQTGRTVNFTSTETLTEPASGQARVEAVDGLISNPLSITVQSGTYTDLILNPTSGGAGAGTATLVVAEPSGPSSLFSYALGPGNNFVTIVATGGELISSTTLSTTLGFVSLQQPRISGAALSPLPPPVAEPGTVLLLGSALGALGFYGWRKTR